MPSVPEAVPQHPVRRYSNIAVAIHWTTVALVLLQIWLGFAFHGMDQGPERNVLFTWHKTIGATILLLTLARLIYRLKNPPPPFTPEIPRWERIAAVWNHRIFYILLIGLPIGGLVAVSGETDGATTPLIGGIPLPLIPGVSEEMGEAAGELHGLLAKLLIPLIAIHVLAALKQQFYDRWRMAGRMPPFRAPDGEEAVIGQGSAARPIEG